MKLDNARLHIYLLAFLYLKIRKIRKMPPDMSPVSSSALDQFLLQCQQRVNNALEQLLAQPLPSKRLQQAMQYAVLNGGKRVRPVLVYGSALAVGGDIENADNAACAVELIHCFSLVHDDMPAMDDDDLRRGKPSLHKAFDEATAILVGDALQALAFRTLSERQPSIDAETQLEMNVILAEAAGTRGMVAGQDLDLLAIGKSATLAELERLHELKTGALIRASVLLGAMSHPHIDGGRLKSLKNYAEKIGLAFQVQDDILDVVADTETLGKPQGSDSAFNKPTYVSLLGLEAAKTEARNLVDESLHALSGFSDEADRLRDIAEFIVNRSY